VHEELARTVENRLARLLHDRSDEVKANASLGLAAIGVREAALRSLVLNGLAGCLLHGAPATRSAALRALLAFKQTAPNVGGSAAAILHELDGAPFRCAVRVIAHSGSRDAETALALQAAERGCEDRERQLLAYALAHVLPEQQAAVDR
jgi:hypothetical protein